LRTRTGVPAAAATLLRSLLPSGARSAGDLRPAAANRSQSEL
jgi:hypothetical protein